jgi:hypothetical protein
VVLLLHILFFRDYKVKQVIISQPSLLFLLLPLRSRSKNSREDKRFKAINNVVKLYTYLQNLHNFLSKIIGSIKIMKYEKETKSMGKD